MRALSGVYKVELCSIFICVQGYSRLAAEISNPPVSIDKKSVVS